MKVKQIRTILCTSILCGLILVLAMTIAAPGSAAQSTGGRIRGTVSDATGGTVVGAKVILVNDATNVSREAETNSSGEYLFLEVPLGTYSIQLQQAGFKKFLRKGVE